MPNSRTAVETLKLLGTFKKSRQPKKVGKPLEVCPKPLAGLSKEAKQEWQKLAPEAFTLGTLTQADLCAFALLCETLATEKDARAILKKDGLMLETGTGSQKGHPAIKVLETARGQAHRLLESFGLTPKGRLHVAIKEPEKPNPFDEF